MNELVELFRWGKFLARLTSVQDPLFYFFSLFFSILGRWLMVDSSIRRNIEKKVRWIRHNWNNRRKISTLYDECMQNRKMNDNGNLFLTNCYYSKIILRTIEEGGIQRFLWMKIGQTTSRKWYCNLQPIAV